MLNWLRIRLHNLFQFAFYEVISITWHKLRLWQINSGWLIFFCLLFIDFFFNLVLQYWIDWKLIFIVYFGLFSIRLSQSHNLGHEFDTLIWVDPLYFHFNILKRYHFYFFNQTIFLIVTRVIFGSVKLTRSTPI